MEHILIPRPLRPGDRIAIVSPASAVDPAFVAGAADVIRDLGMIPVIAPHALGHDGSYSAPAGQRLDDITAAFTDPSVRAILCSRGGYGTVHLLDSLSRLPLRDDPKWVIGFSDISALHALMSHAGIASIHGPMAKHIAMGLSHPPVKALFDIIYPQQNQSGTKTVTLTLPSHRLNREGTATGKLVGGNLAVLADLIATPCDLLQPDTILFIEDIAEPIYKVERILYQLRLTGVLKSLRGLVVGQFTDYRPDRNHASMEDMIAAMIRDYDYPVAFDAPIGHVDGNMPVIESVTARLTVSATGKSVLAFDAYSE